MEIAIVGRNYAEYLLDEIEKNNGKIARKWTVTEVCLGKAPYEYDDALDYAEKKYGEYLDYVAPYIIECSLSKNQVEEMYLDIIKNKHRYKPHAVIRDFAEGDDLH